MSTPWRRRAALTLLSMTAISALAAAAWWGRPDPAARAQDALVEGLIVRAPLDPAAEAQAEAQRVAAARFGLRGGAAAARALVMAKPDEPLRWIHWLEASAGPKDPAGLSAAQAEAVAGWLSRQGASAEERAVAQAWAAVAGDKAEEVGLLLPAPEALPAPLQESGLLVVITAKESLAADPLPELRALHALAPTHRRACVGLSRHLLLTEELRALDGLLLACLAEGPPSGELLRARASAADLLGRPAAAREAYAAGGFGLHAAAVAVQEGLPAAEAEWRAAVGDPVPPAQLHRLLGGVLLGDLDAVRSGLAGLEGAGGSDPTLRIGAAAGALQLGDAEGALRLIDGLDSSHAEVLRARALVAREPDAARAALDRAWAARPALVLAAAHLALLPQDAPLVEQRLLEVDPVELALLAQPVDRDRPWGALLPADPAGGPRRGPTWGLPPALLPPGLGAALTGLATGACAAAPGDPPTVAAFCGDAAAAAALGVSAVAVDDPAAPLGALARAARAASAAGEVERARAAAAALGRRAPGFVGPAQLRHRVDG
jgi:hypothetical protein